MNTPTVNNYRNLQEAFSFINENLFNNELPNCLITYQRKKNTFGYFVNNRFQDKTNATYTTDEISLNPATFIDRSTKEILSTLAHEMCHLWQAHNGKPSRSGYHNAEWVNKMAEIGLIASNTGKEGGKQTGQQMTHYIQENGLFDETIKPLVDKTILFEDRQLNIKQKLVAKKEKRQ